MIDELARMAGTSTRNVRAYQTRGLLPHVPRVGRALDYDAQHVARLRLLARLLSGGYSLDAIGELLDAADQGVSVSDFLTSYGQPRQRAAVTDPYEEMFTGIQLRSAPADALLPGYWRAS